MEDYSNPFISFYLFADIYSGLAQGQNRRILSEKQTHYGCNSLHV